MSNQTSQSERKHTQVVIQVECETCSGGGFIREPDKSTRKCLDCSGAGTVATRVDMPSDVVIEPISPGDKDIWLKANKDDWQSFRVMVSRDDCQTDIAEAVAHRLAASYNAMICIPDPSAHTEAVKGLAQAANGAERELLSFCHAYGVRAENNLAVNALRSALTAYQQSVGGANA